jgi:transposase
VLTRRFEDAVGFLTQKLDHTAVSNLLGIPWAAVGSIAERLVAEQLLEDRFEALRAIGVGEFSFRRHHRYITIVIDHDRTRVAWAGEGKSGETLAAFFTELGPERCASIELVSIDMAAATSKPLSNRSLAPRSSSTASTSLALPRTPSPRSAARCT